jgi:LmbE family N-acetylglucosaminyl deacetylase
MSKRFCNVLVPLFMVLCVSVSGMAAESIDLSLSERFELMHRPNPPLTLTLPDLPRVSDTNGINPMRSSEDLLQIPKGVRVVVFSPHPDDESLAAGGLIQQVIDSGGEVTVVFVTNGDGYPEAVALESGKKHVSVDDFINYGRKRHEEAVQALCELGVQPDDLVFLGFPDGGIDDLLAQHWSTLNPYTSPYTRLSQSAYKDSYRRWVSYAGTNLKDVMAKLLETLSPDWIVLPDPRDDHPDHGATGVFVLDALRSLNQDGDLYLGNMQFFTYLVHLGGYPNSPDWKERIARTGLFMSPFASAVLASTRWINLPLTREDIETKERSLAAHQSQHQMLGGFFKIFVGPHETFGRLDPGQVLAVPQEYARQYRHPKRP